MLPQKILKIMFSKLAEIDFPGITFTKKLKSVSLMANPRDSAVMTMYRYTKYWFVKNITESFTSFVLFFLYVLKS